MKKFGALLVSLVLVCTFMPTSLANMFDEAVTLTVAFVKPSYFTQDMNEILAIKQFEEETNVHIEWLEIPEASATEKVNLIFASNSDMPDVFLNCGISTEMVNNYGVKQGLLAPLDTLIAEYAPTIHSLLEKRPDLKKEITAQDGQIYTMPQLNEVVWNANPDNLFINTDWLDALDLSMPTTLEEFTEVLRAFKFNDPNGNGKNDEIPLSFCYGRGIANDMQSLTGAFGVIDSQYNKHIAIHDGQLSLAASSSEMKEALQWMHQLYSEGLIDVEAFTQDTAQMTAKGMAESELLGCFVSFNPDTVVPYAAAYDHYEALLPLKGTDGTQLWTRSAPPYGLSQGAFAISSSSDKKEVAVKWLDYINSGDNLYILRWGPFGTSIERTPDGKIDISKHNVPPENSGLSPIEYQHRNTLGNNAPYLLDRDTVMNVQWGMIQEKKLERYFAYEPYLQGEVLPSTIEKYISDATLKELSILSTNIDGYINQTKASMIINGFTDEQWNEYLKRLEDMNVTRYLEIYQEAYESYKQ